MLEVTLEIIITNLHTTMDEMTLQIEINANTFIVQSRKTAANGLMSRVFVCVCAHPMKMAEVINYLQSIPSFNHWMDGWSGDLTRGDSGGIWL